MNKYLEKIAELSDENKRVAKTWGMQMAASVPSHAIGTGLGGFLAKKLGGKTKGIATGAGIGAFTLGGLSDLATLKLGLHDKGTE